MSPACVGRARSVSAALGLPRSRRVCFPGLHCAGSRLLSQELSEAGPGLHALPRSTPLRFRFSGPPQRRRLGRARVLCPSQVRAAQVTRCLASAVAPRWGLWLIASPVPAAQFSGCTTGAASQVCPVSLLGSWSLAATLPGDVDRPESQAVLVSNEACLQFGRGCLSGAAIALACQSLAGAGGQQPAGSAQSFVLWVCLAVS